MEPENTALLDLLRHKEGSWVDWGRACQQLLKVGFNPQTLFEETGFQPHHQNQIIVAAQVYETLRQTEAPEAVLTYFAQRGSESLYELRILPQAQRASAATLLMTKKLDVQGAKEVAKAIKESSLLRSMPEGFTDSPGDIVAYQCWRAARQQQDLAERSRLIARGLGFATTEDARHKLEKLLTDFTVVKTRSAPHLPIYRLESDEGVPYLLPVAGRLPLAQAVLAQVRPVVPEGPFRLVQGEGLWVALPGWQVIRNAQDPVGVLASSTHLGLPAPLEEVLIIIDRAVTDWEEDCYFVVDLGEGLEVQWFLEAPTQPLLGQVVLVMRPKRVLDEDFSGQLWQLDE